MVPFNLQIYLMVMIISGELARGNAAQAIQGIFHNLLAYEEAIYSEIILSKKNVDSVNSCAIKCLQEPTCLATKLEKIDNSDYLCVLLNDTHDCTVQGSSDILYFQSNKLFPNIWTKEYTAYSTEDDEQPKGSDRWLIDCNSNERCFEFGLVGLEEDEDEMDSLAEDIDNIICGSFGGDLRFDLPKSVHVPIQANISDGMCPTDMVVTAMWDEYDYDSDSYFESPDLIKCSPTMNGWKVRYSDCHSISASDYLVLVCYDFLEGPAFITGIKRNASTSIGVSMVTCCPLYKV